jgi:hypothetical protein
LAILVRSASQPPIPSSRTISNTGTGRSTAPAARGPWFEGVISGSAVVFDAPAGLSDDICRTLE